MLVQQSLQPRREVCLPNEKYLLVRSGSTSPPCCAPAGSTFFVKPVTSNVNAMHPQVQSEDEPPPCTNTSPPSLVFQGGGCWSAAACRMAEMLRLRDQACLQTPLGIRRTGITDRQREMKLALRIFEANEVRAFRRGLIAFPFLGRDGIRPERDMVGFDKLGHPSKSLSSRRALYTSILRGMARSAASSEVLPKAAQRQAERDDSPDGHA